MLDPFAGCSDGFGVGVHCAGFQAVLKELRCLVIQLLPLSTAQRAPTLRPVMSIHSQAVLMDMVSGQPALPRSTAQEDTKLRPITSTDPEQRWILGIVCDIRKAEEA